MKIFIAALLIAFSVMAHGGSYSKKFRVYFANDITAYIADYSLPWLMVNGYSNLDWSWKTNCYVNPGRAWYIKADGIYWLFWLDKDRFIEVRSNGKPVMYLNTRQQPINLNEIYTGK